jgi:hypothetical protein
MREDDKAERQHPESQYREKAQSAAKDEAATYGDPACA